MIEFLSVFYEPQVGQEVFLRSCVKDCLQGQTHITFWNLDYVGCRSSNWELRLKMLLFGFRELPVRDHQ